MLVRKAGCPLCLLDRDGQGLGHLLCPLIAQSLKEEEGCATLPRQPGLLSVEFPYGFVVARPGKVNFKSSLISLVQKNNVKGEKNIPGQGLGPHCSRWWACHTL